MAKDHTGLTPGNKEGGEINAESSTEFENDAEAKSFFEKAKQRLLSVNDWGKIAGKLSANFQLTDEEGKEVERLVQKNDHFKIDITGIGSIAGSGHDWVRVEDVKEIHNGDVDSVAILVRPDSNPQTPNKNIAHFYSEKSTSTFVVTREKTKVTASILDRNIEANEETGEPLDKLRNAAVGLLAKFGFSKLQWKALTDALVKAK